MYFVKPWAILAASQRDDENPTIVTKSRLLQVCVASLESADSAAQPLLPIAGRQVLACILTEASVHGSSICLDGLDYERFSKEGWLYLGDGRPTDAPLGYPVGPFVILEPDAEPLHSAAQRVPYRSLWCMFRLLATPRVDALLDFVNALCPPPFTYDTARLGPWSANP